MSNEPRGGIHRLNGLDQLAPTELGELLQPAGGQLGQFHVHAGIGKLGDLPQLGRRRLWVLS